MAHYDIMIIGGGLSGKMMAHRASKMLPQASIAIIDKGDFIDHSFHLHRPINELNLKWDEHNFFLGIWDGAMRNHATPKDVNHYAYKVYGKLQPSNIINFNLQQHSKIYPVTKLQLMSALGNNWDTINDVVTYIAPNNRSVFTLSGSEYKYSYIVNTISLPVFLNLCRIPTKLEFKNHPFNIHTIKLGYNSNMYQMIYNTDLNCSISRTTLIDDTIYVESLEDYTSADVDMLSDVFNMELIGDPIRIQPGRFDPIPREDRKNMYYYLTDRYNILLLGRYGSWTFKIANDVWDDTKLLCEIISYKENIEKGASICKR